MVEGVHTSPKIETPKIHYFRTVKITHSDYFDNSSIKSIYTLTTLIILLSNLSVFWSL